MNKYTGISRFCISHYPEVEKKVLAELDGLQLLVTQDRPESRPMIFDDLANMKYTSNAIKVPPPPT